MNSATVGEAVSTFVADLTGRSIKELPAPGESGADWLAALRLWLAQLGCGFVSIANPGKFSWAGHWIGIVDPPDGTEEAVAVLLFGTPSAVIASPRAPSLIGKSVDELSFRDGFLLVPFQPFRKPGAEVTRTIGEIVAIYVSEVKTGPMTSIAVATALKGKGLAGDRYAAKAGTFTPRSDRLRGGYDLTLIEIETLDQLALADGPLTASESRRNLITKGIDLNALVGHEFMIGTVRAFGRRLCEPCVHLERLTRPGTVARLVHRGGLRADLMTDGQIRVGDAIQAVSPSTV